MVCVWTLFKSLEKESSWIKTQKNASQFASRQILKCPKIPNSTMGPGSTALSENVRSSNHPKFVILDNLNRENMFWGATPFLALLANAKIIPMGVHWNALTIANIQNQCPVSFTFIP